ncbi:MAG: DciA family protein [Pyrinomonadaceae bacterium]
MEQLFAALPQLIRELGANHAVEEQMVFAAWRRVAGDMLNERTKPLEYFENRLIVAVEDQNWQRNLESLAGTMVAKLNAATEQGTVKYIEFRIDKNAIERQQKPKDEVTSDGVPDSLRAAADQIASETLRKSFLEAAAAYLKD